MSVPPGRPTQQLTPPRILLVVVVSLLVLLLLVLLVQRAGRGGDDATAGPSSSPSATVEATDEATDEAMTDDDGEPSEPASPEPTPTEGTAATYFASPSGNIACSISADSADCVIVSYSYEPQDLAQCDADGAGGHLRVEEAGASMPCEPLVVAGDVPDLGYGEEITAHGFTCESQESGVTCRHDGSGYGFSVARAAYDLF